MAINARAPMILAQETARDMIRRGCKGAIVNVSSVAAEFGIPDHTAYCASKAALDAMTKVMAVELGPHGIRVNSVNPTVHYSDGGEGVERPCQGGRRAPPHPAEALRRARGGRRGRALS